MTERIYFDNAASTPIIKEVIEAINESMLMAHGNPSSLHREGRTARTIIEDARRNIAHLLNASIGDIFFTSGGTEANNAIIKNAVRDLGVTRIISSHIEHPCVLNVLNHLKDTVKIEYVELDSHGRVDLSQLENLLEKDSSKTLVSLMHINNEIGTINPIHEIGTICREKGALFHSDTVQGMGFYKYDLANLPVDFVSASAHKFHGPKGVGFMYVNSDHTFLPFLHGGQQERNMRAGTENTPYIAGMSKAFELAYQQLEKRKTQILAVKEHLTHRLTVDYPLVKIMNPSTEFCHYKILNIAVPLTPKSELAVLNFDMKGVAISGGSACSSGAETDSHVYQNLFSHENIKMIRVSLSHLNTIDEADRFTEVLKDVL